MICCSDFSLPSGTFVISLVGVTVCVMSRMCCSRDTKPVYRNNVMVSLRCSILKGGSFSYNVVNSLGIEFPPLSPTGTGTVAVGFG